MKPVMLIFGGAQGLGRELAAKFAKNHQVIILDINEKILETVASKLDCSYQFCDVTDFNSVKLAIEKIFDKYRHLDCVINSAGLFIDGKIESNDPALIKKVFEVNSIGPMYICKTIVPILKKQKSGTIININSTASLHPKAMNSVYHASKWALNGFTQSLQLELSDFGIKVVSIYPGVMNTKFTKGTNTDISKSMDPSEVVKSIEFVLSLDKDIFIPELVIKHL